MQQTPYSIYFAGELFSIKHLLGNALLAESIQVRSQQRYHCIVPQDLEQRETTAIAIRNQDLLQVVNCDLGLFHFDGPELDSGTVVEFMLAKMLDIPSVIVRTDFRSAGDAQSVPWNLMAYGYPRTEVIVLDSMHAYQQGLRKEGLLASQAAQAAIELIADKIITSFDQVLKQKPVIEQGTSQALYKWAQTFPGSGFDRILTDEKLHAILQSKRSRGLL
jgi:nucleoside 2-deoxyribosyltransferase